VYSFNYFQENKHINYEDLGEVLTYENAEFKNAAYWDLIGSPILIVDTDPSKNWAFTAANYAWCTGLGTYSDPYIIENVTIDAINVDSGISISDSNVHFIIQNCIVSYAGIGMSDAGIKLTNTSNGQLINNTCSYNGRLGILLNNYCLNNTISGNKIVDNSYSGIYLDNNCDNNTILGNDINNIHGAGIYIRMNCDNNFIAENNANNHHGSGIMLYAFCDGNTLSGNNVNDNYEWGIKISYQCDGNIILGNNASNVLTDNQNIGIMVTDWCDNNIIIGNNANDNLDYGIFLEGVHGHCYDNIISGNNASNVLTINQEIGIYLWDDCYNTIISGNNINNNRQNGIYLNYNCDNSNISGNYINYNGQNGIFLYTNCDNNILSGNYVNYNGQNGISLYLLCHSNTFLGNNATHNILNGISLSSNCDNNILSENYVNNNGQNGIFLINGVDSGIISWNIVNNNTEDGIHLETCNGNTISQNVVENNTNHGMELFNSHITNIYYNFFIENGINANDNGTNNLWDNGASGNYWDNYAGTDDNGDGIGDIPYNISGSAKSQDRYPLINSFPNVEFSANTSLIFQEQSIQFTYLGFGGIFPLTYEWDFGDGSLPSNVPNPVHQYVTAGIYNVSLTVTDFNGDYDTELKNNYIVVIIDLAPVASFNANVTEIFTGQPIKFNFIGSEGNAPATYYWDFDDGFDSTEQNPVHQYITTGTYNVSLTVTDLYGDYDTELKINYIAVIVNLTPDASFNANVTEIFTGQLVKFNFVGSEGNAPATYYWDFDDGFDSTEQNPVHQYITVGTYNVSLTVTDLYGEQDTQLMSLIVTPTTPPPGEDTIPFGNHYLVFAAFSVISLIIMMKHKFFRKYPK